MRRRDIEMHSMANPDQFRWRLTIFYLFGKI
ncbi:hypothetical protein NB231_15123 [Nitrococcus mobilis Nb-231]|uniref:Uncharacterized protein n=1 Tax=Nitrococcus mobilis Nb-231 TaxID=314278 RepID=A4BLH5_9GAMM|nr:hypothetical protein NB231_15123 [Nitrococcus mobilis Nb-231]